MTNMIIGRSFACMDIDKMHKFFVEKLVHCGKHSKVVWILVCMKNGNIFILQKFTFKQ
jgi:hypothetical protein